MAIWPSLTVGLLTHSTNFSERCRSGLTGSTGNAVNGEPFRGFESHPFRHKRFLILDFRLASFEIGFRECRRKAPQAPQLQDVSGTNHEIKINSRRLRRSYHIACELQRFES